MLLGSSRTFTESNKFTDDLSQCNVVVEGFDFKNTNKNEKFVVPSTTKLDQKTSNQQDRF